MSQTHHGHLELHQKVEDLDNQGSCNNISIRNVPESVLPDQIKPAVQAIFTELLDCPTDSPIGFYQIQIALATRPPLGCPPRDYISCLPYFSPKESIKQEARGGDDIIHISSLS